MIIVFEGLYWTSLFSTCQKSAIDLKAAKQMEGKL